MGVHGLTTFIDENQRLLTDFKLQNTRVIIDGNNFYHFLYYYFQVSHNYGGDYDKFAEKCTFFFESLALCNVEPYIVFDGAYDKSGRKLKTALKRAVDRVRMAASIGRGSRGKILPILAQETFRIVLKKLGISHVTCDFEADQQIAALAVQWGCPVITNDSDFFIYDIPSGVILLDYLNLKTVHDENPLSESYHMNVQIYYVENMKKEIGTDDSRIMSLLATLIGNDLVDGRIFEPFFCRGGLPKKCNQFQTLKSSAKIAGLLGWLKSTRDFSTAVSMVLSFFQEDNRDSIKAVIVKSVDDYADMTCGLLDSPVISRLTEPPVQSFGNNKLPDWFLKGIKNSELPVQALNVVTLRRVILLAQVAAIKEPSTYRCSQLLRRFIYALLLSVDLVEGCVQNEPAGSFGVAEYDREGKQMKGKLLEPLWCLDNGRRVPCLEDLPNLDIEERRSLLLDVLQINHHEMVNNFHEDTWLLISTMIFWIRNAKPKVNSLHLEALLVCCLKLGALDSCLHSASNSSPYLDDHVLSKLAVFASKPHHNRALTFDGAIIHAFSQFQSCLQALIFANQLLLLPFKAVNTATVFNGTFVYSLFRELQNRKSPELYVEELLGRQRGFVAVQVLASLRSAIRSMVPEGSFSSVAPNGTKKKQKKPKAKLPLNEADNSEPETTIVLSDVDDDGTLSINCDLNNKFSCLQTDES